MKTDTTTLNNDIHACFRHVLTQNWTDKCLEQLQHTKMEPYEGAAVLCLALVSLSPDRETAIHMLNQAFDGYGEA
jgi:hypothetical protein